MSRTIRPHLRSAADRRDAEDRGRLRRVKLLVAEERARSRAGLPVTESAAIPPITVRDEGPFLAYPASPDDLRAVLSRLPHGTANGIAGIELRIGIESPRRTEGAPASGKMDPFVGRLTHEIAPGLFGSKVLGRYSPRTSRIEVSGYAFDPSRPDRAVVETYLRMKMLETLVHELAHHEDHTTRGGRRQWRNQGVDGREEYARAREYVWTMDVVIPYLEESYPTETRELERWIERHGGVSLPLAALADDPERALFTVDEAFEALVGRAAKGEGGPGSQVKFAQDLRYAGLNDEARAAVTRVLEAHPRDRGALVLQGRLDLDEQRVAEASEVAEALARRDDADADVLELVVQAAQARGDWRRALEGSERLGATAGLPGWRRWIQRKRRAEAWLELGELDRAEELISELREGAPPAWQKRQLDVLGCLARLKRGDWEAAFASASRLLADGDHTWLRAARFEAAHRLGRASEAGELDEELCVTLRRSGYGAWVDRLGEIVKGTRIG